MQRLFSLLFLVLLTFALSVACGRIKSLGEQPVLTIKTPYDFYYHSLPDSLLIHVQMGIPFDSDTTDDFLIFRPQYTLSYSSEKGVPNWVCWYLDSSWYGNSGRYKGRFLTDHSLPDSFFKVTHNHYANTGYDRGHVVRSHERTRNKEDNRSTFLMTNIIPQTPDLNQGAWLSFERFCESLCLDSGLLLWIVSGGVYSQGKTLKNLGQVAVPDSCFKIVLAIDRSGHIIDSTAKVYSVMMPNIKGIRNESWHTYKTTVRQIEYSTGYDFFARLPKDLQNWLEGR